MHAESTPTVPATGRGALAIITNRRGDVLLHLRDDFPHIAWPDHWSVLGGGCDPGESPRDAIVRELAEEAGLTLPHLTELFEIRDEFGSGRLVTFFAATWDGDESALQLTEGVELRFLPPDALARHKIPPFIRTAITRHLSG